MKDTHECNIIFIQKYENHLKLLRFYFRHFISFILFQLLLVNRTLNRFSAYTTSPIISQLDFRILLVTRRIVSYFQASPIFQFMSFEMKESTKKPRNWSEKFCESVLSLNFFNDIKLSQNGLENLQKLKRKLKFIFISISIHGNKMKYFNKTYKILMTKY